MDLKGIVSNFCLSKSSHQTQEVAINTESALLPTRLQLNKELTGNFIIYGYTPGVYQKHTKCPQNNGAMFYMFFFQ